ncbi:MAG TPA: hypothetical protein VK866_04360 [Acidimicrobiales bacterium]|nr:hypothetical protein [Acidimicrobiales bacterium]
MPTRTDFDDEQWATLRLAPWQVGLGVMAADPSGILGRQRELRAVEASVRRTSERGARSRLVALVVDDVLSGDNLPHAEPGGRSDEELADVVVERCAEVRRLLDETVDDDEARSFRRWLYEIAEEVALAAEEGDGPFGERVSELELRYLARLAAALDVDPR